MFYYAAINKKDRVIFKSIKKEEVVAWMLVQEEKYQLKKMYNLLEYFTAYQEIIDRDKERKEAFIKNIEDTMSNEGIKESYISYMERIIPIADFMRIEISKKEKFFNFDDKDHVYVDNLLKN